VACKARLHWLLWSGRYVTGNIPSRVCGFGPWGHLWRPHLEVNKTYVCQGSAFLVRRLDKESRDFYIMWFPGHVTSIPRLLKLVARTNCPSIARMWLTFAFLYSRSPHWIPLGAVALRSFALLILFSASGRAWPKWPCLAEMALHRLWV